MKHGSPRDRGHSDAYYNRHFRPHKWLDGIGRERVDDLTTEEVKEYRAGWNDAQKNGDRKEW